MLREIQALKAHWIVRMIINKGNSWADLMWLEIQRIARTYNVHDPTSFESWPKKMRKKKENSNSLMEEIIQSWNACSIKLLEINNITMWSFKNSELKPLTLLTVKQLYKCLDKEPNQIGMNKYWSFTEKEWLGKWDFLSKASYLSPKDKQLRFQINQGKLWCGKNRESKEYPITTCPICNENEETVDHPLTTTCKETKSFFQLFQTKWKLWTKRYWEEDEWNKDWISDKYINKIQLDLAMTTAKRIIWYNYTRTLHGSVPFNSMELYIKWLSVMKYRIEGIIGNINHKKQDIEGWNLQNSWAQYSEDRWESLPNVFIL